MLDATVLKNEIVTDPSGLGYKNADGTWKAAATIAELISTPHAVSGGYTTISPVRMLAELSHTTIAAIQDSADSSAATPIPSADGRAAAKTALLFISLGQPLDVSPGGAGASLMAALETAGLLATSDVSNLQAAATITIQQSRAQALWGASCVIGASDVTRAASA
ncbi:MAG: hypothetical protein ACYCW6_08500 [Candidatus Xenobia bacterium]